MKFICSFLLLSVSSVVAIGEVSILSKKFFTHVLENSILAKQAILMLVTTLF